MEKYIIDLANQGEKLTELIGQMYEEHQRLLEFTKTESLKLLALETLLIDNDVFTKEELDQRVDLLVEEIKLREFE